MTSTVLARSPLATRRGVLTLTLLCAVQFLDIVDSSIVNVALPSIRADLGFTQQGLQWVVSGYLLTYGGFLLLGGRTADLVGRRRLLIGGTAVFAVGSLSAGLAETAGQLVVARMGQGVGAAMMAPAGLSILTTTFRPGRDRGRALAVWGAVSGVAAAAGVFLGGVLSQGPGWRWVFFVNVPVCLIIVVAARQLIDGGRDPVLSVGVGNIVSAALVTGGMLLLIFALVRAPDLGWRSPHVLGELATAALLFAGFTISERRQRSPLFPVAVLRVPGLVAADLTQLIAFAGFVSMFFFLTLYLQNGLRYTPVQSGSSYLPVTAGIAVAAGVSTRLAARAGTRSVIVAGALVAGTGMLMLARLPVDAHYLTDLLPGLLVMSLGLGTVFVNVTTAANAGVPAAQAGLAAGLLNTALQLGSALGLAVFSAVATSRTRSLLDRHVAAGDATIGGLRWALLACAAAVFVAAAIAARAPDIRTVQPRSEGA
jgi:EmrB/QacA subfamily drug resistance transporter